MKAIHPNLVGLFAVFSWGIFIPISRIIQNQVGIFLYMTLIYALPGVINFIKDRSKIDSLVYKSKYFYIRWGFFVLHEFLGTISVGIVSKENLPIVILLNYLWPSAIIFCSIIFADIKITKVTYFILGTLIVISSLFYEIVGVDIFKVTYSTIDILAFILVTIGAFSWGMYSAFSKTHAEESGKGDVICLFQISLGLLLPLAYLFNYQIDFNLNYFGVTLLLINIILQIFSYKFWDYGMRKGNIVLLSLSADFIPWISLCITALIVGAPITISTVISAIFLVFGAVVTRYGTK